MTAARPCPSYPSTQNILARQPGPEVAEQLAVYQQNLKEKQRQLKAMNKELEMYKSQADEHKYDIQRLGEQLDKLKQQYFARMRAASREQHGQSFGGDGGGGGGGGDDDYDQEAALQAYMATQSRDGDGVQQPSLEGDEATKGPLDSQALTGERQPAAEGEGAADGGTKGSGPH